MKLKMFTLRAADKLLQEDESSLNAFFEEHHVLQIETAYIGIGDTLWSVAVIYELPFKEKKIQGLNEKLNLSTSLNELDLDRFELLKKWRIEHARSQNVPPYRIATNRELERVIRVNPKTIDALRLIRGFGEAKVNSYGADLLQELKRISQR